MNSTQNSEIRKHYYLDRYVIIAPKRNLRPDSFSNIGEPHKLAYPTCPFCGNNETALLALPSAKHWQVRAVDNAFSALTLNNPAAFGKQEVIIETPSHDHEFSDLSLNDIGLIFTAYRHRLMALKQIEGIRYVLVFKNDGPLAGASVAHAHSQVMALPSIPPDIELESDALTKYQNDHNRCAICNVIEWEEAQKVRVVFADKNIVAISPYAASYGFALWLIPRRHVNAFTDLTSAELQSLAVILKKATSRLDSESISFNFFLQESIPHQDHHFIIKVEPRIFKWGGAEIGTGIRINPVAPEYAALWYKSKIQK